MLINTRVFKLKAMDYPAYWHCHLEECNPNDRVYISTEKPASTMSIEQLEKLIQDKRADAIIADATAQLFEAIDILKGFGADIDITTIGINRPDYGLTDKEGDE
jgi:hypothetical protein